MAGIPNVENPLVIGDGAQFIVYLSPQHETTQKVTEWQVVFEQGDWEGRITSANPTQMLQTPHLSGCFQVIVTASGPNFSETRLKPLVDSPPDIGCNANCVGMVGIVAQEDGKGASYWTVWDAICKRT